MSKPNMPPCGVPAGGSVTSHTASPAPCVAQVCENPISILPYCPPCAKPLPPMIAGTMEVGCDWHQSCEPSFPREIGCSPLVTGWGAYDGGVPWWARDGFCETDCETMLARPDPTKPMYSPADWESFLDLNTSNGFWSRLMVLRNGQPNRMSPQEFTALTHKVITLALAHGIVVAPDQVPSADNLGLSLVTTGADSAGKPTYGLSATYAGAVVGTPLALVTERNAAGVATALRFPVELIVAQEAGTP